MQVISGNKESDEKEHPINKGLLDGIGLQKKDYKAILLCIALTILFSIRGGELREAVIISLRWIMVYYLYGVAMVFIFVGLTKKMFRYEASKRGIVLWIFYLAAFFAISQMAHEGFLLLTGQRPF